MSDWYHTYTIRPLIMFDKYIISRKVSKTFGVVENIWDVENEVSTGNNPILHILGEPSKASRRGLI